jgi:hypothetical protein
MNDVIDDVDAAFVTDEFAVWRDHPGIVSERPSDLWTGTRFRGSNGTAISGSIG